MIINSENLNNIKSTLKDSNEDTYQDLVYEKLCMLWGDDLDKNLLLSKRGLIWLGIDDNVQSIADIDEIAFLNKMVDLGKLLSEDNMLVSNTREFGMSPNEAKKIRNKVTSQKEFLDALNDRGHIKHKEALMYINRLNEIIARDI